jgi:hypothetical protein
MDVTAPVEAHFPGERALPAKAARGTAAVAASRSLNPARMRRVLRENYARDYTAGAIKVKITGA